MRTIFYLLSMVVTLQGFGQNIEIGALDTTLDSNQLLQGYRFLQAAPMLSMEKLASDAKVAQGYFKQLSKEQQAIVLQEINNEFYKNFFLNEEFYSDLRNKLISESGGEYNFDFISVFYNPLLKGDEERALKIISQTADQWKTNGNIRALSSLENNRNIVVGQDNRMGNVYLPSLELLGKIKVDDAGFTEILNDGSRFFVFKRKEKLTPPEDRVVTEVAVDKKKKDAKALAENLMQQWENGKSGADLVKNFSDNKTFLKNKGMIQFNRFNNSLMANFVFNELKQPGDIAIFESDFGYHVIKLERIQNADEKETEEREIAAIKSMYGKEVDGYRLQQLLNQKFGDNIENEAYDQFKKTGNFQLPGTMVQIDKKQLETFEKEVSSNAKVAIQDLNEKEVFRILFFKQWLETLKKDIRPYLYGMDVYRSILPISYLNNKFEGISKSTFNDPNARREIYDKYPEIFTEPADDLVSVLVILNPEREKGVSNFLNNGFSLESIAMVYAGESNTMDVLYQNGSLQQLKKYIGESCQLIETPTQCTYNGKTIWVQKIGHKEAVLHTFDQIDIEDLGRYIQFERNRIAN